MKHAHIRKVNASRFSTVKNRRTTHADFLYNGGCEAYEDPADYIRFSMKGTVIA